MMWSPSAMTSCVNHSFGLCFCCSHLDDVAQAAGSLRVGVGGVDLGLVGAGGKPLAISLRKYWPLLPPSLIIASMRKSKFS